jgi:hypothetical protein
LEWTIAPVATLRDLDRTVRSPRTGREQECTALGATLSGLERRDRQSQYAVTTEAGQLLACMVFGSAAWRRARDEFIGWVRFKSSSGCIGYQQYAIPDSPWSASGWILGQVLGGYREIGDPIRPPIALVETFVDRGALPELP